MQSCKITTSWLDLLLASVEVEKYKNWFNPKHCNQALCTEGKWEKNLTQFMLIWFSTMFSLFIDFQQTLCGCWTVIYCNGLNFREVQLCCKFARRRMVLVGKVHKVYTNTQICTNTQMCAKTDGFGWESTQSVQGLSARAFSYGRSVPAPLQTGSTYPTFSERGSLMFFWNKGCLSNMVAF